MYSRVDLADLLGEAERAERSCSPTSRPNERLVRSKAAAMPWFRWGLGVLVLGMAGALVSVVPDGVSAVTAGKECRATAHVANAGSHSVSTIDVKTRTKNPTDIVAPNSGGVAVTPDGKTAFVAHAGQRHGVDDRREDEDQEPHRHRRRLGAHRGGDHAVSPVTGSPPSRFDVYSSAAVPLGD
jgi:hypothetical protein